MPRYVAFLRGMNLGGRRITNDELCASFEALGFSSVSAFLASGNVVFDAPGRRGGKTLEKRIERGLATELGYEVPTFVRTADEVRAIAACEPFPTKVVSSSAGKVQVALLMKAPSTAAEKAVLEHATGADRLAIDGRELYWLPSGKLTESELDFAPIERLVGSMTMRTKRTVDRIAARFLGD